jgi:hypothetical protein
MFEFYHTLTKTVMWLVFSCVGKLFMIAFQVQKPDTLQKVLYLFTERDEPLVEWDYLPPVGPRPPKGFVGLKNAGATCYMNSVLQQLYMVESIRVGILASEGAAVDLNEDFSGEERMEGEVSITNPVQQWYAFSAQNCYAVP